MTHAQPIQLAYGTEPLFPLSCSRVPRVPLSSAVASASYPPRFFLFSAVRSSSGHENAAGERKTMLGNFFALPLFPPRGCTADYQTRAPHSSSIVEESQNVQVVEIQADLFNEYNEGFRVRRIFDADRGNSGKKLMIPRPHEISGTRINNRSA